MTTHWTDRLSDYLDDEMSVAERGACDAHLAACPACRETLGELRSVIATAQADGNQEPPVDLWPAILQQIAPADAGSRSADPHAAAPQRTTAALESAIARDWATTPRGVAAATQRHGDPPQRDRASAREASRQFVFTLPQLALAASLLISVSAGVAYLAAGRAATQPGAQEFVVQAFAEPVMAPSADVERANFADAQYDEAVADLEKILADLRDELNPQTVMIIERNLASIDQAIREARAALDADPANTFLNSHLADARRKKLDLLRRATTIHSTAGD